MSVYELAPKFVSQGPLAIRGGRIFTAWKKSGEQRNTLFEVKIVNGVANLEGHGYTPGTYYKDGECFLAFDDVTGELCMLNFCSPNPTTGGEARPVLWRTGIFVAATATGTIDAVARQQIAQLRTYLRNTP